MATPVITPLPSPPVPTDAPATFATKAGASVTAQAAMVPELNAAFVWQAASESASLGYKNAAAASATASDASATAAAGQVTLAAAQVALATAQAGNAASSATSAQTAAAAAGAAAGLPSLVGNSRKVLGVKTDETGVQWVLALPALTGNAGKILQVNAAETDSQWFSPGAFYVTDEKAQGASAGDSTGSYLTRALNSIKINSVPGASVTGNQITLPAGRYLLTASAPGNMCGGFQARIYNVTSASVVAYGSSAYSSVAATSVTRSHVATEVALTVPTVFRLEMNAAATTNGLGSPANKGPEIYSEFLAQRIA